MMISADELALPPEWFEDGIMQLDDAIATGTDVDRVLRPSTTTSSTSRSRANRVDAMSIVGLARELAASYGVPLRLPPFVNPGRRRPRRRSSSPRCRSSRSDCRRFVAQRFDGVRVGPAPAWMRVRFALAGQRPINNLVDVSNYVMLETGQPLHFYDAAHVAELRLIVRDAREGENARDARRRRAER